jgi:uncharacterized protein (TIGR02611 family)
MTLLEHLKRNWKRAPKIVRQTLVLIFGSTIILAGIAMLVLPGPGWVAIFLGFAILATEFTVAEKARDWMVAQLKLIIAAIKQQWRRVRGKR